MATRLKIKIQDETDLRKELDSIYEKMSQVQLAQWALGIAMHILELINYDYRNNNIILDGFATNISWQKGEVRMHDVRQAGFKVHKLAKEATDIIIQNALRVVGQAIGTGHMKEHAMVASDYCVKVVNLMFPQDMDAVIKEREWQIKTLKDIIKNQD